MINRELIRIKLVQVLYSYIQKGTHNPDVAEKELLLSLDKAYDLYNYLLMLLVEVSRMSVRMLEVHENRSKKLKDGIQWSHKFVDNRFIIQLESNRQLRDYCSEHELSWADHETFVRRANSTSSIWKARPPVTRRIAKCGDSSTDTSSATTRNFPTSWKTQTSIGTTTRQSSTHLSSRPSIALRKTALQRIRSCPNTRAMLTSTLLRSSSIEPSWVRNTLTSSSAPALASGTSSA